MQGSKQKNTVSLAYNKVALLPVEEIREASLVWLILHIQIGRQEQDMGESGRVSFCYYHAPES